MRWLRNNGIILLFILAVIGSYIAARDTTRQTDSQRRTELVNDCYRNSGRSALVIDFKLRVARAETNQKLAADLRANARGGLRLIPAPFGETDDSQRVALAEVEQVDRNGTSVFVLTDRAIRAQREGCRKVFPPR